MFVCDLIRSAKKRLVLIDNFVDERVLTMLDKRSAGVEATVHKVGFSPDEVIGLLR